MTTDDDSNAGRERCRAVCAKFAAAGYYALLGMVPSSDAPGRARVFMAFRSELAQLYGAVHGGAILSMADAAVNLALATTLAEDEATATVDLSMSFLAPVGARDIEARGTVTKRGRRVSFAECVLSARSPTSSASGAENENANDWEEIARAKAVLYVRSGSRAAGRP